MIFSGFSRISVYKRQKNELVASLADAEDNVFQVQLKQFAELCNSETQLNYFRTEADQLALNFMTAALNEQIEEIQKAYDDRLTAEIRSIKPSFWFGVWSSVVGSIIFVLFLGIIVFFSWSVTQGPKQAIESIFNVKITSSQSSPPVPSRTPLDIQPSVTPH